eukprot:368217-Rhodomonas_salina.1
MEVLTWVVWTPRPPSLASHARSAQNGGGGRSVKVYAVGKSMLVDAGTGKASDEGASPDLVLSTVRQDGKKERERNVGWGGLGWGAGEREKEEERRSVEEERRSVEEERRS